MIFDLQKASIWKRISAALLDVILLGIVVVGVACVFSSLFQYDHYNDEWNRVYETYEAEYGIQFDLTQEQYDTMQADELLQYEKASEALIHDKDAIYVYNMVINLTLLIATLSILAGYLILEFFVPKFFGNGQTIGKKIFSIGVMRTDGIKVSSPLMFIRTVLGKFTIETMIPVLILVMISFNSIGIIGMIILLLILILEIVLMAVTHTNSMIHDTLAKTVVVDMESQMIFENEQEMLAYKTKVHKEQAERQAY